MILEEVEQLVIHLENDTEKNNFWHEPGSVGSLKSYTNEGWVFKTAKTLSGVTTVLLERGEKLEEPEPAFLLRREVRKILEHIAANKERLIEAWVAETGFLPSESVLFQQNLKDGGLRFWVEKKGDLSKDTWGKWRPISEIGLGAEVLFYSEGGSIDLGSARNFSGGISFHETSSGMLMSPTHFMELPGPPRKEEDETF